MNGWGLNPESVSAASTVVSAFALIVAVGGAYLAYKQSRHDRNLQAFLALSADIRQRWEGNWGVLLREEIPKMSLIERHSGEVGRQIDYMLNWLDWVGLILKMDLVDRELLLGSICPVIREMLRESAYKIQSDVADPRKGKQWWANVFYVASLPEVRVDIEEEADALRRKWGEAMRMDSSSNIIL